MTTSTDFTLNGHGGALHCREWSAGADPRWIALLCHGYGEHLGRYEWLADRLAGDGAAVYALDHVGHGSSDGEPVVIEDYEPVVTDLHLLAERAVADHPGLPVVLIGHSMGGMIATRYAQRYGNELAAVVLSGPPLGSWAPVDELLGAEVIPDEPIDPDTLSRDAAIGRAYVEDPLVWHGPFKRPTLAALDRAMKTIAEGGRLGVPTLWLHGEDDTLVPYPATKAGFEQVAGPHAKAKTYPGARHEIFNETNKDEVADDVVAFVNDVLG